MSIKIESAPQSRKSVDGKERSPIWIIPENSSFFLLFDTDLMFKVNNGVSGFINLTENPG
jgi:hypothetical protein